MAGDPALNVAAVLTVPPLDQGTVVAGHGGLTREVRWVDIIHAPAEDFVRPGDLVLTTGADIHQPAIREFLTALFRSPAAGVVLSPPPEITDTGELLALLIPLAEAYSFPFVLLPWEIAFADVQKSLLPLITSAPADSRVQMAIGRREAASASWNDLAAAFAESLFALARSADVAVQTSVTDDLVMSHFVSAPTASVVAGLLAAARQLSGLSDDVASWVLLPPAQAPAAVHAVPMLGPGGPVGPQQFAEVLRQHPQSMATILQTLQPLVDYDRTRRGQLMHTLEILLNEAINTSAAARALYLNRHSLLYRIKLIEELTGLSLKNSADRFQLEVSVRVHQLNAETTVAHAKPQNGA